MAFLINKTMKHISTRAQFLLESEKKVTKRPDGSIEFEEWLENGEYHRLGGPAWIWYRPDGSIESEEWLENGEWHRLDGPARIRYRPDGSIGWEEWRENGELHRLDGPARIKYNRDGSIDRENTGWWQEGKKLAPDPTWFARKELKELGFSDEDADLIAPFF